MVAPMVTVTVTAMIAITVASVAAITITITITVVAMGMAARRIVPGAVAVACVATTVARLRACRPILAIPVPLTQRRRLAGFRFGPLRTRLLAAEIVLPPLGRGVRLLLAQVELQRVRCGHEPRFLQLAAAVAGVATSGALVSRQRLEAELRPGPTGRGRGEHVLRVVFAALHKAAALWEARLQPSIGTGGGVSDACAWQDTTGTHLELLDLAIAAQALHHHRLVRVWVQDALHCCLVPPGHAIEHVLQHRLWYASVLSGSSLYGRQCCQPQARRGERASTRTAYTP